MGGLDTYDYGARGYYPAIGRFTTIDPLAEKYYNISPYAYVANRFMTAIDINGEWIYFRDEYNGTQYRYDRDNKAWQQQIEGKWVTYTAEAGSNEEKMLNGLNKLSKYTTGEQMIDFFSNDKNNIAFVNGDKAREASGNFVVINLSKNEKTMTEIGLQESPLFVTIGHEMAHKEQSISGVASADERWFSYTTPSGEREKVTKGEQYATHIENQLRADASLPLRTHYLSTTKQVPLGTGGAKISISVGYNDSALLKDNGKSKFYGTDYRFEALTRTIFRSVR